jgi:hypothetical protein
MKFDLECAISGADFSLANLKNKKKRKDSSMNKERKVVTFQLPIEESS